MDVMMMVKADSKVSPVSPLRASPKITSPLRASPQVTSMSPPRNSPKSLTPSTPSSPKVSVVSPLRVSVSPGADEKHQNSTPSPETSSARTGEFAIVGSFSPRARPRALCLKLTS